MKVVLVGYMASGKSVIGQSLANNLDLDFVDLDEFIENQMGLTIPEIFSKKGEIFFRKKEYECLQELLNSNTSMVLATGGGTPCYGNNMQAILDTSDLSVYLQLSIPSLVERIKQGKQARPLVQKIADDDLPEFIGKHLFERRSFYAMAKETVFCDGKSVEEIATEIQNLLL